MIVNEYFPIVTENGDVIGKASREECHSGSFLLHPVIHLHVFNSKGELYLQKRALDKDIQPGKWDTSVGGHVDYGEEITEALKREVEEELRITDFKPTFIKSYKFISDREAELIHSYFAIYDGNIVPDPVEISEGRFWKLTEIEDQLGRNIFTPNFENEWKSTIHDVLSVFKNKC
jgi:isopentenyldiphosphate isomerase